MHLNINSLLPKIDELRHMTRLNSAAVIGISASELGKSITNSKIWISNYDLLRCDRNRNGGGVSCYIRNDLRYTQNNLFPNNIENAFFFSKTKLITAEIVYQPPNQTNFIKSLKEHFTKLDTTNKETYILGDFNINLYCYDKYIICKNNTLVSRSVSNDTRNYHQFCTMFGLKEIIKSQTRIIHLHSMVSLVLVYLTINLSTVQEKLIKSKQGVFINLQFFARLKSTILIFTKMTKESQFPELRTI